MARHPRWHAAVACAAAIAGTMAGPTTARTAGQTAPDAQSAFRARVDLIPVDVSVLDANRRPVRGLTAGDFRVFEDGKPREIVAFSVVDIPAAPEPAADRIGTAAAWVRDAPRDVVSNDLPEEGRLVVIVLDRSIPAGRPVVEARRIAREAVDQLGPGDLAAVARTSGFADDGRVQGFTSDRSLLLAAAESPFMGWTPPPEAPFRAASPVPGDGPDVTDCQCGLCVLESLEHISRALAEAPRRRKSILFVGSVLRTTPPGVDDPCYVPVMTARREFLREIDSANVTFHVVDPAGLVTTSFTAEVPKKPDLQRQRGYDVSNLERLDELRVLPERTGGRLVANANEPASFVPAIFEESQLYYLLGFEPGVPADGECHRIDVRVNRPDVRVHTRRCYTAAPAAEPETRADEATAENGPAAAPAVSSLVSALHGALPRQQMRVSAGVAAFPGPAGEPPIVGVELGTSLPPAAGTRQLEIVVSAFDLKGRAVQTHEQTVEVPPPLDGSSDVTQGLLTRLNLAPGRYEIRAAVRDVRSGDEGSVFTFADVPDFGDAPVTLSGVVLRGPAPPLMSGNPLSVVLPFVPTVARAFAAGAQVLAYLRVHQPGTPVPVRVRAQVLDVDGRVRFEDAAELGVEAFAMGDAEYGVELPLATLTSGSYLLRIVGTAAGRTSEPREVRFDVEP